MAACLAIPMLVGAVSGLVTAQDVNGWYRYTRKPAFNPPRKVFGPVWTLLYLLMGISLYLVWKAPPGWERTFGLSVFAFQLAFNFLWSILFFRFHRIGLALADIVVIWAGIAVMIGIFLKISLTAGLLQIPYFLWVSFATALNTAFFQLNGPGPSLSGRGLRR